VRSLILVITPKHDGAVLMSILKLFLRQLNCASVGKQRNFESIKLHGMYVKIDRKIKKNPAYILFGSRWIG
jgi:hypothetical protein